MLIRFITIFIKFPSYYTLYIRHYLPLRQEGCVSAAQYQVYTKMGYNGVYLHLGSKHNVSQDGKLMPQVVALGTLDTVICVWLSTLFQAEPFSYPRH